MFVKRASWRVRTRKRGKLYPFTNGIGYLLIGWLARFQEEEIYPELFTFAMDFNLFYSGLN